MSEVVASNPYVLLAKVGVCVAIVGGAFLYGHHVGYSGEKLVYDNYVLKQKDAAEKQVISNQAALKAQADKFASDAAAIQKDHQDEVAQLSSDRDAALANSSVYAERLRQYLARSGVKPAALPGAASGAAGTVATGQSGLLDGVSSLNWYLTQRFHDADVNAATLNEAIALLAKDREICNGSLPGVSQ